LQGCYAVVIEAGGMDIALVVLCDRNTFLVGWELEAARR
jgi:hypothetical protein